jgi:hypothetical protein
MMLRLSGLSITPSEPRDKGGRRVVKDQSMKDIDPSGRAGR